MTIGIASIAFNHVEYIHRQEALLKKHCRDDYEFIVIDNSDIPFAPDVGDFYYRVPDRKDWTESHRWALKCAVNLMELREYEAMLILDHDAFPVNSFSVWELLHGCDVSGVKQAKPELKLLYYGPWVFAYRKGIHPDFWTQVSGADTGGATSVLTDEGFELPEYQVDLQPGGYEYTFVANTFVHYINGSNWRRDVDQDQRIAAMHALVDRLSADD